MGLHPSVQYTVHKLTKGSGGQMAHLGVLEGFFLWENVFEFVELVQQEVLNSLCPRALNGTGPEISRQGRQLLGQRDDLCCDVMCSIV